MGAEKLIELKPILTDKGIDYIVDKALARIENLGFGSDRFEIDVQGKFMIELHVEVKGFNYKTIRLPYLEVHRKLDKDTYANDEDTAQYKELIYDQLSDRISELNYRAEECFEAENEYSY